MKLLDCVDGIRGDVFSFSTIAVTIGVICIGYYLTGFIVSRMRVVNLLLR